MPEHSPIINVCPFPTGNHSWNTVMGANTIKVPPTYGKLPDPVRPSYWFIDQFAHFRERYEPPRARDAPVDVTGGVYHVRMSADGGHHSGVGQRMMTRTTAFDVTNRKKMTKIHTEENFETSLSMFHRKQRKKLFIRKKPPVNKVNLCRWKFYINILMVIVKFMK